MAAVTRKVIKMNEAPVGFTFTEGVVAGTPLDFTGRDDKTVVLINNTGSKGTVTFTKGDGIQGVTDVTFEAPAGFSVCALDSGFFKQMSGENKGHVVAKPSAATITFAVVEIE